MLLRMTDTKVPTKNRNHLYLWTSRIHPARVKVGGTRVKVNKSSNETVIDRIFGSRDSGGKMTTVDYATHWDIQDWAEDLYPSRAFKQNGQLDKVFHEQLPYQLPAINKHGKEVPSEWFGCPDGEDPVQWLKDHDYESEEDFRIDMELRINKIIDQSTAKKESFKLQPDQFSTLLEFKKAILDGDRTILAELCARFGKTGMLLALARELEAPITVIMSYMPTALRSYRKEASRYEQFRHMVVLSTKENGYREKMMAAVKEGRQVVLLMSMCPGDYRQEHIDFIYSLPNQLFVVIDEADYGTWRANQAKPLIEARRPDDIVILATGTNAARALGQGKDKWVPDLVKSVPYSDLLVTKNNINRPIPKEKLKYFEYDTSRVPLIVSAIWYQMDVTGPYEEARKEHPELFQDVDLLPSLSKMVADPVLSQPFLIKLFHGIFEGGGNFPEIHALRQMEAAARPKGRTRRVAMVFLPENTGVKDGTITTLCGMAQSALDSWIVVELSGNETDGEHAEQDVKKILEDHPKKNVLIIASKLGQRSFSISEIIELYLMYDKGDLAATIQKVSRVLTIDDQREKIGHIFSLSFDPNRDDRYDLMVLQSIDNYAKSNGVSWQAAAKVILDTLDIRLCTKTTAIRMTKDMDYLKALLSRRNEVRAIARMCPIERLTDAEWQLHANKKIRNGIMPKVPVTIHGRISKPVPRLGTTPVVNRKGEDEKNVRKSIMNLIEHLPLLVDGTNSTSVPEAIAKIKRSDLYRQEVIDMYGYDIDHIESLWNREILPQRTVEGLVFLYMKRFDN